MNITEFIEARILEDEAEANERAVEEWFDGGWPTEHCNKIFAECAAKRAILEQHTTHTYTDEEPGFSMELWDCLCQRLTSKPCPTVGALASVYKNHPDYQQEWETR